jgi:hypothetical protein
MRFIGIDSDIDRPRIQALRASPPGLAANQGARRRVFGAALGQWDALLGASGVVVPAASPILLFYALSQAGRAVCAAYISGQPWRASGHGLRIGDPGNPIGETLVSPDGGGNTSFAMFCRALKSAPLSEATTLSALWAANQQLESVEGLGGGCPAALGLNTISSGDHAIPSTRATLVGEIAGDLPEDPQEAAAELGQRLSAYPGAGDGLTVNGQSSSGGEPRVEIAWHDDTGTSIPLAQVAPGLSGRPNSGSFLRPRLNQAGDVLPDLAIWWATLIALSSLARYHPEQWTDALNRDTAITAIPIEDALDIGREILPWLLLGILSPGQD